MSRRINLPETGLFITLEGVEGSGKSTMIHYMREGFERLGFDVEVIREPGGTPFSEELRRTFMAYDNLSPETSVHLVNAQRQHNLERFIIPHLERGKIVLADRFTASTLVYQGLLNNELDLVKDLMVDVPDQTSVFVDVAPEIGLERIARNNRETNRFDNMDIVKHQQIYRGYRTLDTLVPETYWDIIIDGEQPLNQIQVTCYDVAEKLATTLKERVLHGSLSQ